jgi:tRNA pseudouridine55 synthase
MVVFKNIFAVFKPKGPTSHDIINEIRKITGARKVGHAGTLDPLASGILVVGVGREATKKLNEIVAKEKEYIADIKLGEESSTDDEEGEKISLKVNKFPSLEEIEKVLSMFIGKIMQTPPIYSSIKISGKPAHRLVREGKVVVLKPREVEIKDIKILKYETFSKKFLGDAKKGPLLKLKVITGPGVYIRALARDIGRRLGIGGYLANLERIRVGEFTRENAVEISDIKDYYFSHSRESGNL